MDISATCPDGTSVDKGALGLKPMGMCSQAREAAIKTRASKLVSVRKVLHELFFREDFDFLALEAERLKP
jgi:hypothetical protein